MVTKMGSLRWVGKVVRMETSKGTMTVIYRAAKAAKSLRGSVQQSLLSQPARPLKPRG